MRAYPWERLEDARACAPLAPWVAALTRARGRCLDGARWAGTTAVAPPESVAIAVTAGAASAVALVPGRVVVAIAEAMLGRAPELPAPRPTTEVERALAAFAVADALAAGGVDAVATVAAAPPSSAPVVAVAIAAPVASHVFFTAARGALTVPTLPWAAARTRAARLPGIAARIELATAPVVGRRLGGLARRDVVVVGAPAPRLRVGRGWFPAALDVAGGRLTVTGPYQRAPMIDPAELFAADATVELTVALGDVRLSARALLELEAGAVLPTGAAVGAPVELRAGDRVVARGELVVVDGAIGVRVHDVLSTPPAT